MTHAARKIYEVLDDLPEEKKKEVLDFAEYLRFREIEGAGHTAQIVESLQQIKDNKVRPARDILNGS